MPNTNQALINHARAFFQNGGSPAKAMFKANFQTGALRTNDLLRKEEWQLLDEALVGVARQRLIGIGDLRSRGLVENLGGLGTLLSQYEKLGDMSAADVDYAGIVDGEKDAVSFTLVSVPVPIIHKDFSINIRRLEASRSRNSIGQAVDRTQIETAAQKVTEQMEEILFNGYTTSGGAANTLDGNSLLGYTNAANVNTYSGSDWGTATAPTTDIIAMIDKVEQDRYFGPYTIYVAPTQFGQLRAFFTDGSGDQIWDRVKRIQGIEDVKPGDRLTDGSAVLVSFRRDCVDLAVGQDLTVIEWETKGGLMMNFKVLTAIAPRVKSDAANGSGFTKATGI